MKPPPFLLSVTLLFWGWQSDLVLPGALMAVILESGLVFRTRWDLSEDDFSKTWSFCSLVLLSAVVYSFTNNEGPSSFATMFDDLSASNQRTATVASARTAAQVIRWLPMIFFPFLAAQTFSTRESIPLTTLSLILQRRWRKVAKAWFYTIGMNGGSLDEANCCANSSQSLTTKRAYSPWCPGKAN